MRIYKTRADFTALQATGSPSIFAGTVCTITDEPTNPMYVYQGGVWNSTVTATTNPVTGGSVFSGIAQQPKPGVRKLMLLGDSMTVSNNIIKTASVVNRAGGICTATATYYPQDDREINFVSPRTKIPTGAATVNFFVYFIFDAAGTVLTADVGNMSIEKM